MKTIITIGRQFGSGGREIGTCVAEKLGIPFYDKELLRSAAEKSGLCEQIFERFDERPKSLLYAIAMDSYMFSGADSSAADSLEQQLYLTVHDTIRRIAAQGPCVLVGRCADCVLADQPDLLRVFIHAPIDMRIARVAEEEGVSREKAKALIAKTDKRRASYYNYYTSRKWGHADSYDVCLDSSLFGLDGTAELICGLVERRERAAQGNR